MNRVCTAEQKPDCSTWACEAVTLKAGASHHCLTVGAEAQVSARGAFLACVSLISDSQFHEAAFDRLCGSRLHDVFFPFLDFRLILLMKKRK